MNPIYRPLENLKTNAAIWAGMMRDYRGWNVTGQYTKEVYLKLAEQKKFYTDEGVWYFSRWQKEVQGEWPYEIDRIYFTFTPKHQPFNPNGIRRFKMGYLEVKESHGWNADEKGNRAGIFIEYTPSAEYIANDLMTLFHSLGMPQG